MVELLCNHSNSTIADCFYSLNLGENKSKDQRIKEIWSLNLSKVSKSLISSNIRYSCPIIPHLLRLLLFVIRPASFLSPPWTCLLEQLLQLMMGEKTPISNIPFLNEASAKLFQSDLRWRLSRAMRVKEKARFLKRHSIKGFLKRNLFVLLNISAITLSGWPRFNAVPSEAGSLLLTLFVCVCIQVWSLASPYGPKTCPRGRSSIFPSLESCSWGCCRCWCCLSSSPAWSQVRVQINRNQFTWPKQSNLSEWTTNPLAQACPPWTKRSPGRWGCARWSTTWRPLWSLCSSVSWSCSPSSQEKAAGTLPEATAWT